MKRKIIVTGIIKHNDEILVVQRSKNDEFLPGAWEFPGGNIEDGELLLDALKRELKEEVSVNIDKYNAKLVNVYDEVRNQSHCIELDYLINVPTKDLGVKISHEHDGYAWVTKDSDLIDDFIKNKLKNI